MHVQQIQKIIDFLWKFHLICLFFRIVLTFQKLKYRLEELDIEIREVVVLSFLVFFLKTKIPVSYIGRTNIMDAFFFYRFFLYIREKPVFENILCRYRESRTQENRTRDFITINTIIYALLYWNSRVRCSCERLTRYLDKIF